jgi:hypothetical protein
VEGAIDEDELISKTHSTKKNDTDTGDESRDEIDDEYLGSLQVITISGSLRSLEELPSRVSTIHTRCLGLSSAKS